MPSYFLILSYCTLAFAIREPLFMQKPISHQLGMSAWDHYMLSWCPIFKSLSICNSFYIRYVQILSAGVKSSNTLEINYYISGYRVTSPIVACQVTCTISNYELFNTKFTWQQVSSSYSHHPALHNTILDWRKFHATQAPCLDEDIAWHCFTL